MSDSNTTVDKDKPFKVVDVFHDTHTHFEGSFKQCNKWRRENGYGYKVIPNKK